MQIVTESTSQRTRRIAVDHDTQEMSRLYQPVQRMPREARAVHGVDHVLNANAPVSNYNTNTSGSVSFLRVEAEQVVADASLQSRLESLCEALRSRY